MFRKRTRPSTSVGRGFYGLAMLYHKKRIPALPIAGLASGKHVASNAAMAPQSNWAFSGVPKDADTRPWTFAKFFLPCRQEISADAPTSSSDRPPCRPATEGGKEEALTPSDRGTLTCRSTKRLRWTKEGQGASRAIARYMRAWPGPGQAQRTNRRYDRYDAA